MIAPRDHRVVVRGHAYPTLQLPTYLVHVDLEVALVGLAIRGGGGGRHACRHARGRVWERSKNTRER